MQDDRHRLLEELVEHAVAQQMRTIALLAEGLLPRKLQIGRKSFRLEEDVVAERRIVDEQVGLPRCGLRTIGLMCSVQAASDLACSGMSPCTS